MAELEVTNCDLKFGFPRWAALGALRLHGAGCGDVLERAAQWVGCAGGYIEIMRAFVRLRERLATHEDLARKLKKLERKYDTQFRAVFDAIRQLMAPTLPPKKPIEF
jgi:hypothetical protein